MPITDEELDMRWQQCETRQDYRAWRALEQYLRGLSRLAQEDHNYARATHLLKKACDAASKWQGMQPKGEPS